MAFPFFSSITLLVVRSPLIARGSSRPWPTLLRVGLSGLSDEAAPIFPHRLGVARDGVKSDERWAEYCANRRITITFCPHDGAARAQVEATPGYLKAKRNTSHYEDWCFDGNKQHQMLIYFTARLPMIINGRTNKCRPRLIYRNRQRILDFDRGRRALVNRCKLV